MVRHLCPAVDLSAGRTDRPSVRQSVPRSVWCDAGPNLPKSSTSPVRVYRVCPLCIQGLNPFRFGHRLLVELDGSRRNEIELRGKLFAAFRRVLGRTTVRTARPPDFALLMMTSVMPGSVSDGFVFGMLELKLQQRCSAVFARSIVHTGD